MWFLLGFLALVLVEIVLLIKLGGAIGLWLTLGWIILAIGFGIVLLKGIAALGAGAIGYRLDAFNDPQSPIAHRGLVMIAGLLFIIPGLLTDVVGFLLLFPPLRRVVIRFIAARLSFHVERKSYGTVIDADWRDVSASGPTNEPDTPDPKP